MFDIQADIPDLTGLIDTNKAPVPGTGQTSPSPGEAPLASGANRKWDVSRRLQFVISNPKSIPHGKFSTGEGQLYIANIPNGTAVSFPTDPLIGNDDGQVDDEMDTPYADPSIANSAQATLFSSDRPQLSMPDAGIVDNTYTMQQTLLFQEFVRVQIGAKWYVIGDPVLWHINLNLKSQNLQWIDNGSDIGLGN